MAGVDPHAVRHALIAAAAWKGQVLLRTRREGDRAVLEVRDNGIGMTEEVRRRCTETHFTTKRDKPCTRGTPPAWAGPVVRGGDPGTSRGDAGDRVGAGEGGIVPGEHSAGRGTVISVRCDFSDASENV